MLEDFMSDNSKWENFCLSWNKLIEVGKYWLQFNKSFPTNIDFFQLKSFQVKTFQLQGFWFQEELSKI